MNPASPQPSVLPYWPGGPPTAEHLAQIAVAKQRGKKVRRAMGVATLSGWTTAIFAGLTLLFSVTSPISLILGAGMCIIAFVEFRGVGELKRLNPLGLRRMAINQLAFGAILFIYGGINLWSTWRKPDSEFISDPQIAELSPDIANMTVRWERDIYLGVYATVIVAAILGPGLTAAYYHTRIKHLNEYLAQTPDWILQLQRAGMSL